MKKFQKYPVWEIDEELKNIQLEEYAKNTNKTFENEISKGLKKLGLIAITLGAFAITLIFINNPIVIFISGGIAFAGTVIALNKELREQFGFDSSNKKAMKMYKELKIDDIGKNVKFKKASDYHLSSYKEIERKAREYVETEEQRKYREALDEQRGYTIPATEGQIKKEKFQLEKETAMNQLAEQITIYYKTYALPNYSIDNAEWDQFLETTYNFFVEKGIEKDYYEAMSKVIRYTISKALLKNQIAITFKHLIDNLIHLREECEIITERDILTLQQTLLKDVKTKIIKLSDYMDMQRK